MIISDDEILLETLSNLLVMDPCFGLEQPRDIDILGPLLLILLALEALHLYQIAHFNFDKIDYYPASLTYISQLSL